MLSKLMFSRNPDMCPNELLFLSALISSAIFTLIMNKRIGYYIYHSVKRDQFGILSIRVLLGLLMLICIYTSVKHLPLVYVSLVSNLGPLLTPAFSFLCLSVSISRFDTGTLLVSFMGVCFLITGSLSS